MVSAIPSPRTEANHFFNQFVEQCRWIGLGSLPLILWAALLVACTLVIEAVVELEKYSAQDLSGALIALGLLRELGPLIVGLAWAARIAVVICSQAFLTSYSDSASFISKFVLPSYLAALLMSIPLAISGLTAGFVSGGLTAPLIGRTSTADFFETARYAIHYSDLTIYFFKLCLVNTTIAVLVGSYFGFQKKINRIFAISQAVSMTFIIGYAANLIVTYCFFYLWIHE